jgi:hypothetical protein
MFHLSTEELCVILVLLEEEENIHNSEKLKRKRFPVHKMLNKRKTEGEYWTLYKELMDDEETFLFSFFWVSLYRSSCKLYKNGHSRTNSINFSLSIVTLRLNVYERD